MNVLIWLLAGVVTAWIACSVLNLAAAGTMTVSAITGLVGVVFGGDALGPAIGGGPDGTVLSPFAVLVVCAGAIGCLKVARIVHGYFSDQRPAAAASTADIAVVEPRP